MSASIAALVAQLAELTEVLRPVAARLAADVETSPAGRDTEPAPEGPAVATAGQPGDQPVDERAEQIAGLRELVDWLEAHPAVPIESTLRRYALYPEHWVDKGDTAAALSELRRISDAVGIELTSMSRHVYLSVPPFRGGVEVELVVCDAAHLLHGEEPAAGGSAEPTDIPRGGEEVAGPAGEAGSATTPEPDPCPKGDPGCETGDDGSCHDGCVAPESEELDSGEQDRHRPDACVGCTYLPGPNYGVRVSSAPTCPVHGSEG